MILVEPYHHPHYPDCYRISGAAALDIMLRWLYDNDVDHRLLKHGYVIQILGDIKLFRLRWI